MWELLSGLSDTQVQDIIHVYNTPEREIQESIVAQMLMKDLGGRLRPVHNFLYFF